MNENNNNSNNTNNNNIRQLIFYDKGITMN